MKRIPLDRMTVVDLVSLYDRLERAEAITRRLTNTAALPIRRALEELPVRCRYHGERLDPDRLSWGREACCDTGTPSLRRRKALAALDSLTAPPPDTPSDTPSDVPGIRSGIIQTGVLIGETVDCGPLPTREGPGRTPTDTDTAGDEAGVRFEYRATVPRHLLGAAVADALGILATELADCEPPPARADNARTPPDTDTS